MSNTKLGFVIRDPWYDFGTLPSAPNRPNYIAQARMGGLLKQSGARWVRLEFQIDGDKVEAEVARNDYFINEVAPRYGLEVLGLLGFGLMRAQDPLDPQRGLVAPSAGTDPVYGGGVNSYMRAWLDRARFVAQRYGERVRTYEILNEMNRLPPSGAGVPATIAARLHTKFYRFFRQVDRYGPGDQAWRDGVKIIFGGLHPLGTGDIAAQGYVSDLDYVYQLFGSDAFSSYRQTYGTAPIDGLAHHPYPAEIRLSLRRGPRRPDARWEATMLVYRLDELRKVLGEVGQPELPLWVTEVGCNIATVGESEARQSEFMDQVLGMLRARPDVAAALWFKYEDFPPATGPGAQRWGVVHIPFYSGPCPGGACYDVEGRPDHFREAFYTFRRLAGQGAKMWFRVVSPGPGVIVRQGPGESYPPARIGENPVVLQPGYELGVDRFVAGEDYKGWNQWAHIVDPAPWGFVHLSNLEPASE
ncbi:MAG: hypothetical protein HGA45_13840 [Chloroflexales bacterium]|nr:hypothetical protein [Chloroflexales bacterium]